MILRHLHKHRMRFKKQIENPSRMRWFVFAQGIFNLTMIVLVMIGFGTQHQFSDYLNQRGQYHDRVEQEQAQAVCSLIARLHADQGGQLAELAKELNCPEGPLPGRITQPSLAPATTTGRSFSSIPTDSPSGGAEPFHDHGAPGTVPARTTTGAASSATGTASPTRAPQASAVPTVSSSPTVGTAPVTDGPGVTLCIPLTRWCLPLP